LGKGNTLPLFKGKRVKGELKVDLAWDLVPDAEEDYDLDLSAFLVTRSGKVPPPRLGQQTLAYRRLPAPPQPAAGLHRPDRAAAGARHRDAQ
jgi:TerD domain